MPRRGLRLLLVSIAGPLGAIRGARFVAYFGAITLKLSIPIRYIKGNIDVWSSEECDGALLNGAQAYLTFTYVMLGITLLLCCCMCCGMMLVGVFVASAEQANQQRSRVATEEPRVTELH